MHGRNCVCLLAGLFFLASLLLAQSAGSGKLSSSQFNRSDSATKAVEVSRSAVNGVPAHETVVPIRSTPIAPSLINPRSPLPPDPVRQPLPWRPPVSPAPTGVVHLARAAGIIFSGTVTRIERFSTNVPGQAVGTVAITFHVEKAIHGTRDGEFLTISQWIGLWSSGQRYRVGERMLLFLYPRSRIGLTSCVGSGLGRFAVDSAGDVWLSSQQILAFRTDPVLGGKSRVRLSDFASAVRWASEEE